MYVYTRYVSEPDQICSRTDCEKSPLNFCLIGDIQKQTHLAFKQLPCINGKLEIPT